jgi:ribose-phosphate pyrophosphokinase
MAVKIFSGSATTYLAEKIANAYGEPLGEVNYQQFSDGEMSPFLKESYAAMKFLSSNPPSLLQIT